jgi:U3 small nucleolar RNA-associated protein 14
MKKIWVNKADSFKKAEEFDQEYYQKMTPFERLDIMQYLREIYFKFKRKAKHNGRIRLRRVLKIIKQK